MFVHTDPHDRSGDVYGGTTLVSGSDRQSYLLLPFIPREAETSSACRRSLNPTSPTTRRPPTTRCAPSTPNPASTSATRCAPGTRPPAGPHLVRQGVGIGAGLASRMRSGVQYWVVGEGWIWLPVEPLSGGAGEPVAERIAAIPATAAAAMAIIAILRTLEGLTVVHLYSTLMAPPDQCRCRRDHLTSTVRSHCLGRRTWP